MEPKIEATRCSGGDCVEVEDIGGDWFRVRSSVLRTLNLAVTGAELRAFLLAVKAGQFDEIAGLEPGESASELLAERDYLLGELDRMQAAA